MESRTKLTEDEIEDFNQESELKRRFEEDYSVAVAEQADCAADAETEQEDVLAEQDAEDDYQLKQEIDRE
ncbi:MAG: hypothetical protein NT148_02130, partial [Candidatus Nealsonbacteria bacterium]|nr:hypothetical protein [Candidatus Nealsonbacteria bacterium]